MKNEAAFKNKLDKALKTFNDFKTYCSKFTIDISKPQVCILGVKKLVPFTKENFSNITWFSHCHSNKVLIKFSSNKPLVTKINGVGFKFGAYELPLDKFKITILKDSISEQDKQVMLFMVDIKKWAKKNKVSFLEYSKTSARYDCCVFVSDSSQDSCSTGVAIRKEPSKFSTSKWDNESDSIKDEFDSMTALLEYLDRWLNSDETKQIKSRIRSMKTFVHKDSGKKVTAYCKEDALKVFAFNADRISSSTKALYETMNEGSFQYNYRTNDSFRTFINDTLLEEVVDNIRSSKELIKKCVEKRVQSYSIVWDALNMIFEYVKKANRLSVKIDGTKIKNWFAFNNADYKTALMPIVEYVDKELRPELRVSEKPINDKNKVVAFYDSNKLEYNLKNLKTEIDGFIGIINDTLKVLDKFEDANKCKYQYSSDFNSKEAIYNIRVRRNDNEIRNYAYTLSEGLKSELRSYKYFGTTKREIPSIIKDIEEFLK